MKVLSLTEFGVKKGESMTLPQMIGYANELPVYGVRDSNNSRTRADGRTLHASESPHRKGRVRDLAGARLRRPTDTKCYRGIDELESRALC